MKLAQPAVNEARDSANAKQAAPAGGSSPLDAVIVVPSAAAAQAAACKSPINPTPVHAHAHAPRGHEAGDMTAADHARSDASSTNSQGSPANQQPSQLSSAELKVLLRTWCDAIERPPARPVEEIGPEKRVEFDVRPRAGMSPPPLLPRVPGLVDKVLALLKITSPTLREHSCGGLSAFSGSSLILFAEWRIIITTPQRVHIVRYLLRLLHLLYEAGYETEWASFVRKNNDSPWQAKDQQIAREFSVLKTIFPTGRSYVFGAVDQDHYFYYIYDDVRRSLRVGTEVPERDGRRVVEDNVQFNLKMYNIQLSGAEPSLKRFDLEGLSVPQPHLPRRALGDGGSIDRDLDGVALTAGAGAAAAESPDGPSRAPAATPPSVSARPVAWNSLGTGPATAGEEGDIANNHNWDVDSAGAGAGIRVRSGSAADDSVEADAGANGGGDGAASGPRARRGASGGEEGGAGSSAGAGDELAVEVITQASRFLLPDQYETLRLLRDVKFVAAPGAAPGVAANASPRYVATYETTIDRLDETRSSLVAMVREFQPERFTIIALLDPESPAAAAIKNRVSIGVEPALFSPEYSLLNRTINRFTWGYQVLSYTYARTDPTATAPR